MRILETSDVAIDERTDSSIFLGEKRSPHSRHQMKMSTPKLGTNDLYSPDFTMRVKHLSHSTELYDLITQEEFKEELFRLSETIDLHAKNLLSDSGIESFLLPDSDEDELSLARTSIKTLWEGSQNPLDEIDSKDAESRILTTTGPPSDFSARIEGLIEDSCEMSSIELDLSAQADEVPDDEMFLESMRNLSIGSSKISVGSNSGKFNPYHSEAQFDKNSLQDFEPEENIEQISCFQNGTIEGDNSINFMYNGCAKSLNPEKKSNFFFSFLPNKESSLCSLPEKAYAKIAESLLDERTLSALNAEENCLSNLDSDRRITIDTPNIVPVPSEMASSNNDSKPSLSVDETDPSDKMCPMTYVDLDINGPSKETLMMFERLSVKDDKIFVCRGNPSEEEEIQNPSLCSQADKSDFEDADSSPLSFGMTDTQVDLNAFANSVGGVSVQGFCPSKIFPPSNAEFNFVLPSAQTFKPFPEANSIEERVSSEINSLESSLFPSKDSSIHNNSSNVNFLDSSLEDEIPYEDEFVTKNLHKLKEVKEILGLAEPEIPKTIPQRVVVNCDARQNPFATGVRQSFNSNVIPRVMTQTPGTQSDAIPTFSGVMFVVSTSSIHGLKRPQHETLNKSAFYEADSRKKAKQSVAHLTDKQLSEFVNRESCLHEAVRSKDYEYVLVLLKRLTNNSNHRDIINSKNGKNQTALHLAVQEKIPAIVHLLIKYGADVNHLAMTPSNKLETPLHYVASRGIQFKLVFKCLLEATDLDINIKNSEGQTALHCAAEAHGTGGLSSTDAIDCEYIIKKLLNCGADPLLQDNRGKNLLMYLIESKDLNLLNQVIKTINKDDMQVLLAAKTTNGHTCLSLTYSLKEQFNQSQWEKINNMLSRHVSNE